MGEIEKTKTTKGQLVIDVKVDALPVFCRHRCRTSKLSTNRKPDCISISTH